MNAEYKPRFRFDISLGNILTLIGGLFVAASLYFTLDGRSIANERTAAEIRVEMRREVIDLQTELKDLKKEVITLQTDQARYDERFVSVLSLLERIDARLQRIEETK